MDRRKVLLVAAVLLAVVGAGLVLLYVQDAENRAADQLDTVPVLIATREIEPGESIEAALDGGKLLLEEVPRDQRLKGSTDDSSDLSGQIALSSIFPGEQLLTQKFGNLEDVDGQTSIPIPEGNIAITLELTDTGRVGAFTQPGSHVVVFVVPVVDQDQAPARDNAVLVTPARVLMRDLLVLGVGSRTVDPEGSTGSGGVPLEDTPVTLLTVSASQEQAQTLIGVQNSENTLTFGLRNEASLVEENVDLFPAAATGTG